MSIALRFETLKGFIWFKIFRQLWKTCCHYAKNIEKMDSKAFDNAEENICNIDYSVDMAVDVLTEQDTSFSHQFFKIVWICEPRICFIKIRML